MRTITDWCYRRTLRQAGFLFLPWLTSVAIFADDRPFREAVFGDEFVVREEMIAMRDGIKLYTLILIPKDSEEPLPIVMVRTPYDVSSDYISGPASTRLGINLDSGFLGDDYIYVFQNIRGRYKSEGDYVMMRPPRGPLNDTETDHTTDAWDSIDWLIENLRSNGRVGVWGTSYEGWLTLAAIKDPHPAIAAAVPVNPMVDVWKADDWFHWGAFRGAFAFDFIYSMQTRIDEFIEYPYEKFDLYQWLLDAGALGSAFDGRLDERHEIWRRITQNPHYSREWQAVAADQWFDSPQRLVPTLNVHALWDQEDIYGSPAVYSAIEKHDRNNDLNYFVAGPWYHGQIFSTGENLGNITFDESTAVRFRENILVPFLRKYLHDERNHEIAPVTVFETGTNRWRQFDRWPPPGDTLRLYLQPKGGLSTSPPDVESSVTTYVSDPAKPVPFAPRPNWAVNWNVQDTVAAWQKWMVEDQRFVDGRPDVVTWVSDELAEPLMVRGPITAHLFAETTGSDADWVVKLIDVYPDPAPGLVSAGYQLMVSGEIFRGRYRENYERPAPVQSNMALEYTIPMPHVNHTFNVGHRMMIQIQSSWFPLYDRNPQNFVETIMYAPDDSYTAQQHRIHHARDRASFLELNADKAPDSIGQLSAFGRK